MSLFADGRDPPSISGVWGPRGSALLADCARGHGGLRRGRPLSREGIGPITGGVQASDRSLFTIKLGLALPGELNGFRAAAAKILLSLA